MAKFILKTIIIYGSISLTIIFLINFFSSISFSQSEIEMENGKPFKVELREILTQKFTANRDGLNKVDFLIGSLELDAGDIMKIEIADESCENILRKGLLEKTWLSSENLYRFKFERIPDSEQKIYCIKATLLKTKETVEPIKFFTTETPHYQFLAKNETTLEDSKAPISIRPGYKNSNIIQDLSEINKRISQYKPWFLKHYTISILSILVLMLSFGTITIIIKNLQ